MTEIVPTTPEHMLDLYGEIPKFTVRAKTALRDGEVYGIGGIYVDRGNRLVFIRFKDHADKRAIVKLARSVRSMFSTGVIAIRDTSLDLSEGFLKHWGFRQHMGDYWVC
jgi:hypothetical protein